MEPNKKICFQAIEDNKEYNNRILNYLESIGGKDRKGLTGNGWRNGYYYIRDNNQIEYSHYKTDVTGYELKDIDTIDIIDTPIINNNENLKKCFELIINRING